MGYVAKLTRGNYSLDLSSGRYKLADDFIPPTTLETIQTAGGTATNRLHGARQTTKVASNTQFNFKVQVVASSSAEVERAIADIDVYLRQAGEESEPLYFEWRPDNNVPAEPFWGQFGASKRVEVIFGAVFKGRTYGVANLRGESLPDIDIELEIKPYARGPMQRLGVASGFIWENNIFSTDGLNNGLHVGVAATNLVTNPVFSNSTYDTNWTDGGAITQAKNTDKQFRLFGKASAELTATDSTGNNFYTTISLSATTIYYLTAYAKLPDGSVVSGTQINLLAVDPSPAELTIVGARWDLAQNGWYRLTASFTSAAGGSYFIGVKVTNGYTVYLDGVQCQTTQVTPVIYGDLLGCAWSGTEHASTSTATVGLWKIAAKQQINVGSGTMRIAWETDRANTAYGGDVFLFRNETSNFGLYFDYTNDRFVFTDGTNAANGAGRTFSTGDKFIIHCTWSKTNGLALYVNGAADGAGNATYTPPALGTANYLGSNTTPAAHCGGIFKGLAFYRHEMTAAQVSADYDNAAPVLADKQMIEPIPYRWDKDADGNVDNCIEGSTYHNYIVCGGIPGSVPAETEILIDISGIGSETKLVMALAALDGWINPDGNYWRNTSGTATAATDVSSDVKTISVNTTNVNTTAANIDYFDALSGRSLALAIRARDAGANLTAATFWDLSGSNSVLTDFKAISANSTSKLFILDGISLPNRRDLLAHRPSAYVLLDNQFCIGPTFVRTSAGAANVLLDYVFLLPRPLLEITYSGLTASDYFLINGRDVYIVQASGGEYVVTGKPATVGHDAIELEPNRANILFTILGGDGEANTITRLMSYSSIDIVPKYAIL